MAGMEGPRGSAVKRVAVVSLSSTVLVVAIKLGGAWLSGSVSVLAEALQSTLDILMSGIVVWAVHVSSRPADPVHPFGHSKAELLASFFQMILALGVAAAIIAAALPKLWDPTPIRADWGLAAMGAAVALNGGVIVLLKRQLVQGPAPALESEAAHLWSDSLASLGVMAGLALTWATGFKVLDPLTAIIFTAIGAWMVAKQLHQVIHPLMDGALPAGELARLSEVLEGHPDVKGYHNVLSRSTGRERRVQMHVLLDDDLTFVEAHDLAEKIESEVSRALGGAVVTIHYEPYLAETRHRREHHPAG